MTDIHDPERSAGFLISDVARLLRRNFNRRVQRLGLTQSQWQALAHLSRNEGINQVSLAEILEVQPITLARLIDRMEAAGWVERRRDPNDRRAVRLYLGTKVQPVLSEMREIAAGVREEAMSGLSEEQRERLLGTLRQMKRNLLTAESRTGRNGAEAEKALADAAEDR